MSAYSNNNLTLPSINQDFIDLSGCNVIDLLPLDDKQKELINKAISGELFTNPVQALITEAFNTVGEFVDEVQGAVGSRVQLMADEAGQALQGVLTVVDPSVPDGSRPENVFEFISRRSNEVTASVALLEQQTEILSGLSLLDKDTRQAQGGSGNEYNTDGGIDEFPGLVGITNLAQGFNQTVNSLDPDNLQDRFSGFFDSVSGQGSELMEGFNAAARGDIGDALAAFRGDDGNLSFDDASQDSLLGIIEAYESVNAAANAVEALVNNERALAALAVDYLTKTVFGFSVLALLADPCFGKKIAEKIFNL